jgi:hypothetical protein
MRKQRKVLNVRLTRKGVVWRTSFGDQIIAPAIQLRALGERETDSVMFVEIRFRALNGSFRSELFERSKLLPEKWLDIKVRLADLGYEWPADPDQNHAILSALKRAQPQQRFYVVAAPGWYGPRSAHYFLPPNTTISSRGHSAEFRLDPRAGQCALLQLGEGSLRGWQKTIAKPARSSSRMVLAICASFAAPLLRPLGMDSFGMNFYADTSGGKTLLEIAAASVLGLIGPRGLPGWADSQAGLEALLTGHRDCLMPLDETADGEQQMPLEKKVRMLSFSISRNRPRKLSDSYERGNALFDREFRTIVLSSSERSFHEIAHASGQKRLPGEEVRFIDVPADEPGSLGIFDRPILPRMGKSAPEVAKELAEDLKNDAQKHQGHVFREFLWRYQQDPAVALSTIKRYMAEFESKAKVEGRSNIMRIRKNFAVIAAAGALAVDYGLLPWGKKALFKAVEKCLRGALNAPERHSQALAISNALRDGMDQANFVTIDGTARVADHELAGRQKADGFVIGSELFLKADRLKQWLPNRADRIVLQDRAIIRTTRKDTPTIEKKIAGVKGKPRYYVFNRKALERFLSTK